MKTRISFLILPVVLITYSLSCNAQDNLISKRPIVPDSTGLYHFKYNDCVSTRDYMTVVSKINQSYQKCKSMKVSDAIAMIPRSKIEFFPFYFSYTGKGAYYRQFKEAMNFAFHLLFRTACKQPFNDESFECFYVILNLYRLPPAPSPFITDAYYGDVMNGLQDMLYGESEYRFLCLYSAFDEELKTEYQDWYEWCISDYQ